jgi:mRNA interferase MazF
MKERDVVIASLQQADGSMKQRPAIILRVMPPFQDMLVCGISSQLHHYVKDFDDMIDVRDGDYVASGVKSTSLIRLSFLSTLPTHHIIGVIGSISEERHRRLLNVLSSYLTKDNKA